jgi:hypothetical protein
MSHTASLELQTSSPALFAVCLLLPVIPRLRLPRISKWLRDPGRARWGASFRGVQGIRLGPSLQTMSPPLPPSSAVPRDYQAVTYVGLVAGSHSLARYRSSCHGYLHHHVRARSTLVPNWAYDLHLPGYVCFMLVSLVSNFTDCFAHVLLVSTTSNP